MRQLGGISQEIIRSFLTLFAPGAVALSSWVGLAADSHSGFANFLAEQSGLAIFAGIAAASLMGLLLDDVGTQIEHRRIDKRLKLADPDFEDTWLAYLRLRFRRDEEPLGQHYIRTIVLKLKFELATGLALVVALLGFVPLSLTRPLMPALWIPLPSVAIAGTAWYLLWEATQSAEGLPKHRKNLLDVG